MSSHESWWIPAIVGVIRGALSGAFGIGGGSIAVPALMTIFGIGDPTAKGTNLLMLIPTSTTGTVQNVRGGLVNVRAGLIVGIAATAASFAGVWLAFLMVEVQGRASAHSVARVRFRRSIFPLIRGSAT